MITKKLGWGMFARSLAGHDKGRLYVVLEADEEYALLADGRLRTVDKPKKKKIRHLQPDLHISAVLAERREAGLAVRDEDVRKALKAKEEGRCQKQM